MNKNPALYPQADLMLERKAELPSGHFMDSAYGAFLSRSSPCLYISASSHCKSHASTSLAIYRKIAKRFSTKDPVPPPFQPMLKSSLTTATADSKGSPLTSPTKSYYAVQSVRKRMKYFFSVKRHPRTRS